MEQKTLTDPLRIYCRQIDRFQILSKKEEADLLLKVKEGDKEAVVTLANSNTRFVVKIAQKYIKSEVPILDLISEGNIGLIRAIEGFDASKIGKIRLITYAVWWIKQKILAHLHEASRTVRSSSDIEISLRKLYKLGVMPRESVSGKLFLDSEDIKNAIGSKSKDQVIELNRLYLGDVSLQNKIGEDGEVSDLIPDGKDLQDLSYETNEVKENIQKYLEVLTDKEKYVINGYFGLVGDNTTRTLEELGSDMGVSRERIRQIKNIALNKLKFSPNFKELASFL